MKSWVGRCRIELESTAGLHGDIETPPVTQQQTVPDRRDAAPTIDRRRFLRPRYWPTWVALGLVRAIVLLPLPAVVGVGSLVGELLYLLAWKRRQVSRINLRIAFPEESERSIRRLNRAVFRNVVIGLMEMAMTWWKHERLVEISEVDGLEHLRNAEKAGKGVIVLGAHFTCVEVVGAILNQYVPLQVMYKRPHDDLLDRFMTEGRSAYSTSLVSHHKPLTLLKGLKRGQALWYAPDHNFGRRKETVFVPFFGVGAATLTAPARIARISGAPVVPCCIRRKPYGSGYRLTLFPPLENFPTGNAEEDALTINRVLERLILQNPRQYMWIHKRYKHRADGRQGFYPSRLLNDPPDPTNGA